MKRRDRFPCQAGDHKGLIALHPHERLGWMIARGDRLDDSGKVILNAGTDRLCKRNTYIPGQDTQSDALSNRETTIADPDDSPREINTQQIPLRIARADVSVDQDTRVLANRQRPVDRGENLAGKPSASRFAVSHDNDIVRQARNFIG